MRVIAKTQIKYGQILLALLTVITGFVLMMTSARAAELPTSENPAKAKWETMKPSSFQASIASVLEQCNRAAGVSKDDRLTVKMCQEMAPMIADKKCSVVMVPDGTVFDLMNGQVNGRSGVALNQKKALGREDRALLCDLGNRTYAYWFTGEKGKSCNNVGIVFVAPPTKAAPPTPAKSEPPPPPSPASSAPPATQPPPGDKVAEPEPEKTCGWVLAGTSTGSTQVIEMQGRILQSCLGPYLVPGLTQHIQGGSTVIYVWSCKK
jgi:hypothetical protein